MRIGILTSGGDCSGLNAVIRAVVASAINTHGWEVFGIHHSTQGLMERPVNCMQFTLDMIDGTLLRRGGTILGSVNRGDPFAYPMPDGSKKDRSWEIIEGYRMLGLDALVGIGGDGSFAIIRRLAQQGGMNLVGVPKTIDNDLGSTDKAIGFDTAVSVATEALDRLQPTAASHNRVMVLEVMGRDAGHIALSAGLAGGADIILIPEIPYRLENIANKIRRVQASGRKFALAVVAEAVKTETGEPIQHGYAMGQVRYGGIGQYLVERLPEFVDVEARCTVLGHVQRGGTPTWNDRVLATACGVHAVELIARGEFDRLVVRQGRDIVAVPILDAISKYHAVELDGPLVRTARELGVCLGDN